MIIGLTGGIGSGKSTVSRLFEKQGFPIVDVDKIAHEIVKPNQAAWKEIVDYFGENILLPNNEIDRKQLGNIIFQDHLKRQKLNEITHPIIISTTLSQIEKLRCTYEHIIVDMPLLFESKRESLFDKIIVVYVDKVLQLDRLMQRDQISKETALQKISAQMDLEIKRKKADIVIYNDQGIENTEKEVIKIIEHLTGPNDK